MPRSRSWFAVVALAALLVVPISITAPAAAAPQPTDPSTPPIPARYLNQTITWTPCVFDTQVKRLSPGAPTTNCAQITVPMDWRQPDAHPDVRVAIAYSRATGQSKGLMMTNPGGPGGAGLSLSAALAIEKPQLFTDFDLVGFDPRGFGASTPLRCLTTAEKLAALPTTPDYRERTAQTHRTEVAEARLYAEACSAEEFGQFVSSQQTVYDMELIRAMLGSRLLNFIGYSYGTWLGGWYADTYPSRVGRFVLDSNMDFTRTQWQNVNFDPFSAQRRRDTQLFPWIARHADQIEGLGQTPAQVLSSYERIRGQAVTLVKAGTSSVRGDNLDGQIYSAIYSNTRFIRATLDILVHDEYVTDPGTSGRVEVRHTDRAWARLAPALQAYDSLAALRSRYQIIAPAAVDEVRTLASRIADARAAAEGAAPDAVVNLGAVGTVVRCNDTAWSKDPEFYIREADRMAKRYPFFGYLNGVPMCAFWTYAPQDRRVDLAGSPRVLMTQAEVDPATAYEGAARTRRTLAQRARFVAIDDEGQHGQYVGSPSACVDRIGDRFVFSGELPGRDRVCGTSPLPEDGAVYPVDGPVDGVAVRLPARRASVAEQQPNRLLQRVLDQTAGALS